MAETNRQTEIGKVPGWAKQCLVGVMPDLVRFLSGHARRRRLWQPANAWTPFKPCATFLEAARSRGSPVEIKSYPSAVHAFESPDLERRELPAYRSGDGPVPVIGTDDEARADAVLRVLVFLKARLD